MNSFKLISHRPKPQAAPIVKCSFKLWFQLEKDRYWLNKEICEGRDFITEKHPETLQTFERKVTLFKDHLKDESCRIRKCKGIHHQQAL